MQFRLPKRLAARAERSSAIPIDSQARGLVTWWVNVLALIVVSLTLIGASVSAGSWIARTIELSLLEKSDDLFAEFWLGFSVILVTSVALVACLPLRIITTPAIILFGILAIDGLRRIWSSRALTARDAFLSGTLVLLASLGASQPSPLWDTGLYHYQIMEWYRSYGAVPGVALLHHRLGFTSSLFALESIAEWSPLKGIGNVVNATCLIVSLWFTANKLYLVSRGNTTPLALYWPICMIIGLPIFERSLFSTSPDVLVCLLVVVFGWFALQCGELAELARSWRPAAFVVVAAGAYSAKANGLALVAVSLLVAVHIYRMRWTRIAVLAGLSILLVLPVWITNAITTGYPLFPMVGLRLPSSWALSYETAKAVSDFITDYPFHHQSQGPPLPPPLVPATLLAKLGHLFWVDNSSLLSLGILNVLGLIFLARVYRLRPKAWPISIVTIGLLAIVGIGLAVRVPMARFVLGYLVVVPAFALAHLKQRWLMTTFVVCLFIWLFAPWQYLYRLDVVRLFVFGVMILLLMTVSNRSVGNATLAILCLCFFQYVRPLTSAAQYALAAMREPYKLLLPPAPRTLELGEFVWVRRGEVSTRKPVRTDQCWAAEPPCAPADANFGTVKNLRYRKMGDLSRGFVQSE